MINTNLQAIKLNNNQQYYLPSNAYINSQPGRLNTPTFKGSSFAPTRPDNFKLYVDGEDASYTPFSDRITSFLSSIFGKSNNTQNVKAKKGISYLA